MIKKKYKALIAVAFLCVGALGTSGLYMAGNSLIAPNPRVVGALPGDLVGETVRIPSASGSTLVGWFVPGRNPERAIVLLHGAHASRLAMLDRARLFGKAGYSVLLVDFQASGESAGEHITYGYLERHDAIAAVGFVRERVPTARVGVIGVSMGGAAALLAGEQLRADALVLEAVYSTLDQAVRNRLSMRYGAWAMVLTPLLTSQTLVRLGFSVDELRPVERVRELKVPVFVIAGSDDLHTTLDETEALAAAANDPKQVWVIPGAAHVDLYAFTGEEYRRKVVGFLDRHLSTKAQPN